MDNILFLAPQNNELPKNGSSLADANLDKVKTSVAQIYNLNAFQNKKAESEIQEVDGSNLDIKRRSLETTRISEEDRPNEKLLV